MGPPHDGYRPEVWAISRSNAAGLVVSQPSRCPVRLP